MTELIPYINYLKKNNELPKHITHQQYLQLRTLPSQTYSTIKLKNNMQEFIKKRDELLIDFMWETGGRVTDLCNVTKKDIDFDQKVLKLSIKKTSKLITINLSQEMLYDISLFYNLFPDKEPFSMTRQNAWERVRKYGKMLNIHLHPHMFRHGLAVFLLYNGIPIEMIAYRLGHANSMTTAKYYLVITPEIEKRMFVNKNIVFR